MKMTKLFAACAAAFLLLGSGYAYAAASSSEVVADQQQIQVTGTVVDAQGVPVPGASVIVKGSSTGTMTDLDGKFTISARPGATLEFSCIGYATVEVAAQSSMRVVLQEDNEFLEESVVTALGIKRDRKSLGYAVEDIKAEELMRNKTANAINSLSGKIAGVNITQSSGAAGSGAQIILRGATSGSEGKDNQPLFIVDGVIFDNSSRLIGNSGFDGTSKSATTTSNRVMDINPEDIESMSVLKGPAASALYGSRAANGVVIITTKKGKDGAVEVNFNSKFTASYVSRLPEVQKQYTRGYMEDTYVDGEYTGTTFNNFAYTSWGEKSNAQTYNNLGDFFQTGNIFDESVSVSGGTKNSNFYLSGSLYDQTGVVPGTGYTKYSFRFNGEQKLGRFTFGANVAYSDAHTDRTLTSGGLYLSSGTGALAAAYTWSPFDDMTHYLNEDGSRYRMFGDRLDFWEEKDNPYWIVNKNKLYDDTKRFTGNVSVKVDIAKWWWISYRLGIDTYNQTNTNQIHSGGAIKRDWKDGMLSNNLFHYQYLNHNLLSNWNFQVKDFDFNILAGLTTDQTTTDANYKMAWNFQVPDFYSFANAATENKSFEHNASTKRLIGVFGELRASWKDILFLTVTGRNDWTSTLPVENRSYFYPSVSGSFVFSQLLQDLNVMDDSIFSFGKLRASWAQVGKDTGVYETATSLWPVHTYLQGMTGIGNYWNRGNPYLKPEITQSTEIGLELSFLKNRLHLDVAYYTNNSYNQILSPRGPQSTGYIFCSTNVGNVYNKGIEFTVSATPIETRDFSWELSLNAAGNRGTLDGLPDGMNVMYVTDVQYAGAQAASFSGSDFMAIAGTKWTRDNNGNVVLNDNYFPTYTTDLVQVGNREARVSGGFNNTLRYKGFTFNMLWEYRIGGDVINGTLYAMDVAGTSKRSADWRNQSLTVTGVQVAGKDADGKPIYSDVVSKTWKADEVYEFNGQKKLGYNIIKDYYTSYYQKETANYITSVNSLRLRTISLNYDFPSALLKKTGFIKRASVNVAANNLLLFTNYYGDPEMAASGAGVGGSSSVGFDYCGVPATAGFTIGLNLTF